MPAKNHKFKSQVCHIILLVIACIVSFGCGGSTSPREAAATKPVSNAPAAPSTTSTKSDGLPVIVAFGDSITAGYGLGEDQSYTTLLQRKLDEAGYRYRVVNAGVSGDTTAGGARRIDWALEGNVKYLILELGGNDGLRGLPVAEMKKNLAAIIERAQARNVTVILAGMESPPNLGSDYTLQFRQAFRDLAKKYNVPLIPFVLEGVGGRREMNQPDGIHPNAEGEKILTETVWRVLEPMLK
ncbi:MAG: arylesterase [Blastocatellia bacterium]